VGLLRNLEDREDRGLEGGVHVNPRAAKGRSGISRSSVAISFRTEASSSDSPVAVGVDGAADLRFGSSRTPRIRA
jgi:hypothetical protein